VRQNPNAAQVSRAAVARSANASPTLRKRRPAQIRCRHGYLPAPARPCGPGIR